MFKYKAYALWARNIKLIKVRGKNMPRVGFFFWYDEGENASDTLRTS